MNEEQKQERLDKAVEKAKKSIRTPGLKSRKVSWMGDMVPRKELQAEFNEMHGSQKVMLFTENRRAEIYQRLENLTDEERFEDAESLFNENMETLDYDNSEEYADFDEAYWMNAKWLALLMKHKQQLRWMKNYKEAGDV